MTDSTMRGLILAAGLVLAAAMVAVPPAYASEPLSLCTGGNTVAMSVRISRFTDADISGALDRWTTQGDFNFVAGTDFNPVDDTPPVGPRVWVGFEYDDGLGGSPAEVFIDHTEADANGNHFVAGTGRVRIWKYNYRTPDGTPARIGFSRGRLRNLPAGHEPSNKIHFQMTGSGEDFASFSPPLSPATFTIRQTLIVDARPEGTVFCAQANTCCRAFGPELRVKCKSCQ